MLARITLKTVHAPGLELSAGIRMPYIGICKYAHAEDAGLVTEEWPPNMTKGYVFLWWPAFLNFFLL